VTYWETLRTGVAAIRAHRLRSVLTMLGIVIGISSVILTVGLGQGAQDEVKDEISALGSNLLIVSPGSSTSSSGVRGGFGSASTLTLTDAAAIADHSVVPDARAVAPTTTSQSALTVGETNWTTSLVGTTSVWNQVRSRTLASGRFFSRGEVDGSADVVVLGPDAASELFAVGDPVGQTVTVGGQQLTVIGVLASSGASSSGSSEDDVAVVPIGTAKALTGSASASVSTIYVEAGSQPTLTAAYQEIDALLLNLHGVSASGADFSIATQDSLVATANSTNRTLTVLLAGIAAISLLVGGIGVMNIMLVSVTERIREIGLRKALGATPRLIRRQFLVEASVLGLAGGVVGVLVGYAGAAVLPGLIDQPVAVSALATTVALGTALVLGLGFGVYPASRAARLTPIDALRSE
jgi:putative ABC transport system permease protein